MKQATIRAALPALLCLAALAGCTSTRLTAQPKLPPPLVEKQPVRIGVHYSKEFSEYVHRETRGTIDYEVTLGPAHVTNMDWLLKAMFAEVVHVDDPTRVSGIRPPLALVLEPKFEEYSFLTPKDVAGEAFIVTIRYLLTLYDGSGNRVDAFTYTGYGRERARTLASKEPLQVATQRAMRDAGAKVAVELPDQDAVRLLLRTGGLPGVATPAPPRPPPPTQPPEVKATPSAEPQPGRPPAEEPPAPTPPAEEPPAQPPPAEEPPAEEQPVEEPPSNEPAVEEPPAEEPPPEAGR